MIYKRPIVTIVICETEIGSNATVVAAIGFSNNAETLIDWLLSWVAKNTATFFSKRELSKC